MTRAETLLVAFLDGPLAGQTRHLPRDLALTGWRHPILETRAEMFRAEEMPLLPGEMLVADYRVHRRLVVTDSTLPGFPLEDVVQVEMRMSKPPQVAAVERLLNEWRQRYMLPAQTFGDA